MNCAYQRDSQNYNVWAVANILIKNLTWKFRWPGHHRTIGSFHLA